jgi:glyoxylase-like metal-dependent hydrolase (beta-lactamase superfamily II)
MLKVKTYPTGALQTNTYIVYDEASKEAAIIDAHEFSPEAPAFINENVLIPKYFILTHGHGDHIGGLLEYVKKFPQLQVVAAEKEKPILGIPENNYTRDIFKKGLKIEPDIYVHEGDELKLGAASLKVIECPGHTPGGISLYSDGSGGEGFSDESNAQKICFTGDTLFLESCGRADLFGGDWAALVRTIQNKLYALPKETVCYPGHGPATEIGYEIVHNQYVRPGFDYPGE